MSMSLKLKAAGHRVLTAVDGSEAIAAIAVEKPDFVLIDINFPPDVPNGGMPAWDGFQLMLWLRSVMNTMGTRFITITASDSPELEMRARSCGAVAFFRKPIDHQRLLAVIEGRETANTKDRMTAGGKTVGGRK
jgi:CheY-like chemotaxis protein